MTARHWRIAETVFRLWCAINCFVAAALYHDFSGGFCLGVGLAHLMLIWYEHCNREARKASWDIIEKHRENNASLRRSLEMSRLYADTFAHADEDSKGRTP